MGIVSTISEKCKRCYSCVRECPAKAIKVETGQAVVIEERCIACGNCVKVCAQKAKRIEDSKLDVRRLLAGEEKVFACLAPSFPAALYPTRPGKVIAAIRGLGFKEVWEVSFGAELISREYVRLFQSSRRERRCVITSTCPSVVAFVEKYMPSLIDSLAPIVSPMVAVARAIKHKHGPDARIVFIGPCIAKKSEILDARANAVQPFTMSARGAVDAVMTYKELKDMLDESGISPEDLPRSGFDGPRSHLARSLAISGGLLKTTGIDTDILEKEVVITEGKDRVIGLLRELAEGRCQARVLDVLFCEGCINGPKMLNDLSVFARKEIMADYIAEQNRFATQRELIDSIVEFDDLDLSRGFARDKVCTLPQPDEEDIARALKAMKKYAPSEQLNCGACGYHTCREKAVAVCQGLAEAETCLPYLIEELQEICERLEQSHEELNKAQRRLVISERLASMGQLSAGVAHEINNPLGTILIFSKMMQKQVEAGEPFARDLEMIVSEATRCRNIVRGLLNFARQSRVSKEPTDLANLIKEVMTITSVKAGETGVKVTCEIQDNLPIMMVDATQVKQMLINLVENGIDACGAEGWVNVSAKVRGNGDAVELLISDNGCGVARENIPRLFTPFFTTKARGKGTGLGLAIAYGIVKMHSGDIIVDSEVGHGTKFHITLPTNLEEDGVNARTLA